MPNLLTRSAAWVRSLFRREPAPGRWEEGSTFTFAGFTGFRFWVMPRRKYRLYVPRGYRPWRSRAAAGPDPRLQADSDGARAGKSDHGTRRCARSAGPDARAERRGEHVPLLELVRRAHGCRQGRGSDRREDDPQRRRKLACRSRANRRRRHVGRRRARGDPGRALSAARSRRRDPFRHRMRCGWVGVHRASR